MVIKLLNPGVRSQRFFQRCGNYLSLCLVNHLSLCLLSISLCAPQIVLPKIGFEVWQKWDKKFRRNQLHKICKTEPFLLSRGHQAGGRGELSV